MNLVGRSRYIAAAVSRLHRLQPSHRHFSSFFKNDNSIHLNSLNASFPYVWLRDNCQCSSCVHPSTRQKLHKSSDFSPDVRPVENTIRTQRDPDGLAVEWMSDEQGKSHRSFYDADFLKSVSSQSDFLKFHHEVDAVPWSSGQISELARSTLSIPFSELSKKTVLLASLTLLKQYGIVFIKGMSTANTSSDGCELRKLAGKLGDIRKTFYGEVWDVRNVHHSKNIAYTTLDLDLHMDLLYYQNPPRYQILHCLKNRVIGGQSIFVDGLFAAHELFCVNPSTFAELAKRPVHFHYINDGHHLHCAHHTIELDIVAHGQDATSQVPTINCLNYSPPFQAPLPLNTPPTLYSALLEFATLLKQPELRFEFLLEEGDAVVFDNRRVLHGRTAFSEKQSDGTPEDVNRWLKGCYLDEEAVWDRYRVLNAELEAKQ